MANSLRLVREFLAQKRIAVVGVSRDPRAFSRTLFGELRKRGYDVVPVNPAAADIDGQPSFSSVGAVTPPVDGALLLTPATETRGVVEDCARARVTRVWMYRAGGKGSVDPQAAAWCRQQGMDVVEGECPFMFLPDTPWFHRTHGFVKKIFGAYPR